MKKLISTLSLLSILMLTIVPAFAANLGDESKGTITVTIRDFRGNPTQGSWFLHQYGPDGMVVRNGISTETFQRVPGNYYLEARNTKDFETYSVEGANPITLTADSSVNINVNYYETEEDKELADGGIITPLSPEEDVTELEEEMEPEEGPTEEELEEEELVEEPAVEYLPIVYVPEFSAPPAPEVPEFSDAPSTDAPEISAITEKEQEDDSTIAGISGVGNIPSLAQTGGAGMLMLLPSILGSLMIVRPSPSRGKNRG